MHRIDPLRQDLLIDSFDFLGPKRKEQLETGWPARFRRTILEAILVAEIKPGFHERMGRPTKELWTLLGVLILQQMFDLTDDETDRQLAFNLEWHFALGLFREDDATKHLCERTMRVYRAQVTDQQLDTLMFRTLTDALLDKLKIPTLKQRLDSTHIRSDMRRLSQLELFRRTLEKFLQVMRREHRRLLRKYEAADLVERYLGEKNGYFAQVKPSEASAALQQAAEAGVDLIAPTPGKPQSKEKMFILDDFTVDNHTGEVTACPAGEAPSAIHVGTDGALAIGFDWGNVRPVIIGTIAAWAWTANVSYRIPRSSSAWRNGGWRRSRRRSGGNTGGGRGSRR